MTKQWVDVTKEQFKGAVCTSYTGGAAWFKCAAFPDGWLVFAGAPTEVRRYFDEQVPRPAVRFEFVPVVSSKHIAGA